jgi:mycothiol synthase
MRLVRSVANKRDDPEPLRVQLASLDEQAAALTLVYSHLEPAEAGRRVEEIVAEATTEPPAGLWVGHCGNRFAAALLVQRTSGETALVSAPRVTAKEPVETARRFLAAILAQLAADGVKLLQALVKRGQSTDALLLAELEFRHACDLSFMVSLARSFPDAPPAGSLEYVPYSPAFEGRLAAVIERTYQNSLDCPQVDGLRTLADVLAGYRATGVFDPSRWLIVRHDARDVGCLLLADHPRSNQWELIYMGVAIEVRGKGFGLEIVRHAQWLARQAGRERLVLAVDAANAPAVAAYAAAGFVEWDQRSMFLRVL